MDREQARALIRGNAEACRMEWGVEQGTSEEEVEAAIQALEAGTLPDPAGGCICGDASQDVGGYVEHLLEYEPACPVHSTHLYDPRSGVWLPRLPQELVGGWLSVPLGEGRRVRALVLHDDRGRAVQRWVRAGDL